MFACTAQDTARRIDPLHGGNGREHARAAVADDVELEPGESFAVAPGALPATLPVTALPSMCSQFGPA